MIIALFLAAAAPSAVDAEFAFARDAQRIGQWTAFRKWADRDAVTFTPKAVWARDFLKNRKDPPKAIRWRPAASYVSCDGHTAVNTGPWFTASGKAGGSFTTVWQYTHRHWRWVYDGGGPLKDAASPAEKPRIYRTSCAGRPPGPPIIPPPPLSPKEARTTPEDNGRGQSADRTLGWDWNVDKRDVRHFRVYSWNGQRYLEVLTNEVPPQ